MIRTFFKISTCLLILFCSFYACKKKDETPLEESSSTFDKQAMLVNFADQLILPSYQKFKSEWTQLIQAVEAYNVNLTQNELIQIRLKFQDCYLRYQQICIYEIGPAEQNLLRTNCNIFPTDTIQIKSNISSLSYNLGSASNVDAKGLPAIEFLLFGDHQTIENIHQLFANSSNRRKYLMDLSIDIQTRIDQILSQWSANYRNTFVNALGTDVSSSIGLLINQMNYELDFLKNAKLGIPLGKKTLGIIQPSSCENYYSGFSVSNAIESLVTIESLYLGRSSTGPNGLGFDDYLDHLKIQYNGESLNAAINKQFGIARSQLSLISPSINLQLASNPSKVEAAYMELVKLLVLLKTDLPSNIGVIITYQDGDGD